MATNFPKVTILMPVYNGEYFLNESINSILNQKFNDFEFLIINDGSKDKSIDIINSYRDDRIKIINNANNQGLISILNQGIKISRGQYIARMDCDDISLSHRLITQVNFMDSHPNIDVCGSWVKTIGDLDGQIWRYPVLPNEIKCQLFFECPLAHPTVMIRKTSIQSKNFYYDEAYQHAEDYELWERSSRELMFANIGEVLLLYRCHTQQVVSKHALINRKLSDQIRLNQLNRLGIVPSTNQETLHHSISTWNFSKTMFFIKSADDWLQHLNEANQVMSIYPKIEFSKIVGRRWFYICLTATNLGFVVWRQFWQSPLSIAADLTLKEQISFGVKCGIKFKHKVN
jgi:glycosyltransferase involved in cell wall biosynthesis